MHGQSSNAVTLLVMRLLGLEVRASHPCSVMQQPAEAAEALTLQPWLVTLTAVHAQEPSAIAAVVMCPHGLQAQLQSSLLWLCAPRASTVTPLLGLQMPASGHVMLSRTVS